jgi:hypothetical protein
MLTFPETAKVNGNMCPIELRNENIHVYLNGASFVKIGDGMEQHIGYQFLFFTLLSFSKANVITGSAVTLIL